MLDRFCYPDSLITYLKASFHAANDIQEFTRFAATYCSIEEIEWYWPRITLCL